MNEAYAIAKRAARILGLNPMPEMRIYNYRRGRAWPWKDGGYFYIPKWTLTRHRAYWIAYIIHELCHFEPVTAKGSRLKWCLRGHGKRFRRIEAETAECFGLRLVYNGTCYPKEIWDLESGRVLCGKYGLTFTETDQYAHPACLI